MAGRPIVLGVCAMAKKAFCKPMQETLNNLHPKEFDVVIFDEKMILEKPVEEWPTCEALICFFSTGFPQEKAEKYVELRKPFLVNDLVSQRWLRDRRKVYEICREHNIPIPFHIIVNRDTGPDGKYEPNGDNLVEGDDFLEIDGQRIDKPFVEKPVDADDHAVFVYYPRSSGGGRKELFRKIGDRSSEFYPDRDQVRKEGSYVYEEFLATEGTDVKVYAVTGAYAHAEARKSPTMDGRVVRDENKLEVRYPVTLSHYEKELAAQVCDAFKQRVCGFDMLRSKGQTFVCDVNGWSFVKRNPRHLKDSAMILSRLLKNALGRQDLLTNDDDSVVDEEEESEGSFKEEPQKRGKLHEELRAVIAIVRHGDRTPKQKLKFKTIAKRFLALLKEGASEIKLKTASELSNVLSIINELLEEYPSRPNTPAPSSGVIIEPSRTPSADEEFEEALLQARAVLEIGGTFKGINRKVQIKAIKYEDSIPVEAIVIIKWGGVLTGHGRIHAEQLGRSFRERLYPGVDGLLRLHSTYRHDLKIYASDEGRVQVSAAAFAKGLLDLEGHLTPLLASLVRKGPDVNAYLDDASGALDEMEKAKAALRTTLGIGMEQGGALVSQEISGAQSVKTAISRLNGDMVGAMEELDKQIKALTSQLKTLVRSIRQRPARGTEVAAAMRNQRLTRTPSETLFNDFQQDGGSAAASLGVMLDAAEPSADRGDGAVTLADMLQLSFSRWDKLSRDFFKPKTRTFDASKIPDIYDSAKYDVTHNTELLRLEPKYLHRVYHLAKCLADVVVPQEYGASSLDKFKLGAKVANSLASKIRENLSGANSTVNPESQHRLDVRFAKELGIKSADRHVVTRVYFTSESHMHSMLNILRFAHLFDSSKPAPPPSALKQMENVDELDYLSHIVLRLYEVTAEDGSKRSIVRVAFSPGATVQCTYDEASRSLKDIRVGYSETAAERASAERLRRSSHVVNQLPPAAPLITLWNKISLQELDSLLATVDAVQ